MNPRARSALVIFMAVVGSITTAIPTHMLQPWKWLGPLWIYHAAIAVANAAAWAGCALAVALALRQRREEATFWLGLFLTLGASAYGLWTGGAFIAELHHEWITRVAQAAMYDALLISGIALFRFASTFPRDIDIDTIVKLFEEQIRKGTLRPVIDERGTLSMRFESRLQSGFDSIVSRGPIAALSPWYQSRRFGNEEARNKTMAYVRRLHTWFLTPANIWRWALILGVAVTASAFMGLPTVSAVLAGYTVLMAWIIGLTYMRLSYTVSEPDDRRRALWVVEGLVMMVAPGFVVEMILMPLIMVNVPVTLYFMPLYLLSLAVGFFAMICCLYIAAFHSGSFDAALVIRRTTMYSALVVVLTGAFAILENFLTNAVAAHVALPANTGAMIAAVVVALAFGPLRDRLKRFVEKRLPLPAETNAARQEVP